MSLRLMANIVYGDRYRIDTDRRWLQEVSCNRPKPDQQGIEKSEKVNRVFNFFKCHDWA